jgi:hypothetical protein
MQMSNKETTRMWCMEKGYYARLYRFKRGRKKSSSMKKEKTNRHNLRRMLKMLGIIR